jgi:hypothetical protein
MIGILGMLLDITDHMIVLYKRKPKRNVLKQEQEQTMQNTGKYLIAKHKTSML